MSASLQHALDSIAIQLGIIHCLSTDSLIGQEVQEFVPGHFSVVFAVQLTDHSNKGSLFDVLYSSLELFHQVSYGNAIILGLAVLGHTLW